VTPGEPLSILHALAGYRPRPHGGSVLYPLAIAAAQSRTCRVALFAADVDPLAPPYRVVDGEIGGVPARRVAKPGLGRFDAAVGLSDDDAPLDVAFREWLARVKPDVVHFHALVGLSASLPRIARSAGCGVVFTLHDLTAICPTGTMVRPGDVPCPGPEAAACRRCLSSVRYLPASRAALAQRLLAAAPGPAGRLALRAARAARAPLLRVLASRGPAGADFLDRRALAAQSALACAHRVVAPSRFLAEGHRALGLDAARVVVQPLGIARRGPSAPAEARPPGSPVRFGFLGNVRERKGVHLLVRAFAALPRGRATLCVHGAGDAPYVESLRRAWPPGATIGDHYDPGDAPALLSEMDVLVVPSLGAEGFPLVVQEAFAHGLPVVTSAIGGQAEVVRDGVDGLHFRNGDDSDLARVLRRFVDEPGLLALLRAGIRPPVSIDEDAERLRDLHGDVRDEVRRVHDASA
jgi:glycosyltransferase involved in cell wall biosynthesis